MMYPLIITILFFFAVLEPLNNGQTFLIRLRTLKPLIIYKTKKILIYARA